MTEKERMLAGLPYSDLDPELLSDKARCRKLLKQFNNSSDDDLGYRSELLHQLFGATGKQLYIEPPFRCDYGCNTYIGEGFYANFDCIILDVAEVHIGKNVLLGPRTCIFTPWHPIDAEIRNLRVEGGKPVNIGDNVWIGGGVIINPGVTIGSNVVIGSGSVVTRDIPDNVVAVGNPCRVLRPITDEDKEYWKKQYDEYRQWKNNQK